MDRNDPKFRRGVEVDAFAAIRSWRSPVVYEVTVKAPAIDEVVTTSADSKEQAKERAVASALQRQAQAATVTIKEIPPEPTTA